MNTNVTSEQQSETPVERTVVVIGFGRRLAAALIDGIVIGLFAFVLAFCIGVLGLFFYVYGPDTAFPFETIIVLCSLIVSVAYYVRFWAKTGQTVGNMLLGIRVIGHDGSPISSGKAFVRYIGYIVSGLALSIGFLWLAFDRKRQGWHDKLAGTYVIYDDTQLSDVDAVKLVPSDPGKGWVWLVLWVAIAIIVPPALFGGLLILGPVVNRAFIYIFTNLL